MLQILQALAELTAEQLTDRSTSYHINGSDAMTGNSFYVVRLVSQGQDAAVHRRVKGLDTPYNSPWWSGQPCSIVC